jgi:hypothetical protein
MFLAAFTSALQAYPQATQAKRAWLLRLSAAMCPHALQRCEVNAALIFSTRPGALSSSRRRAARAWGSAGTWTCEHTIDHH